MTGGDHADAIETVGRRADFLERLAEEPLRKRAMVDALGHSRSTVDRAIAALEEAGLVERTDEGYVSTLAGRLAVERYREYVADSAAVLDAGGVLAPLPTDA